MKKKFISRAILSGFIIFFAIIIFDGANEQNINLLRAALGGVVMGFADFGLSIMTEKLKKKIK